VSLSSAHWEVRARSVSIADETQSTLQRTQGSMTRSAPAARFPQESRAEDGQPKTSGSALYRGRRTGP
jgi:hypothetical protein